MLCFKRPAIRPTSTLFTYDPEKPWCQGHQRQALFKCRRSLSYPPHRRNNTTDWALSGSLQTLGPYRAVLMSRAQLEGAGAEAQSVHKGPTCSFPRNILVCVHGTAPSVYNWSPEWTLGLTNLIPLKMVLCSVLLTWCLFFYFFLWEGEWKGTLKYCISRTAAFLHKWPDKRWRNVVETRAGGRVTGAQRQVSRLRLYLQAILDAELCSLHGESSGYSHSEFSCHAYSTSLNWVWRFVLLLEMTFWNRLGMEWGML